MTVTEMEPVDRKFSDIAQERQRGVTIITMQNLSYTTWMLVYKLDQKIYINAKSIKQLLRCWNKTLHSPIWWLKCPPINLLDLISSFLILGVGISLSFFRSSWKFCTQNVNQESDNRVAYRDIWRHISAYKWHIDPRKSKVIVQQVSTLTGW